MLFFQPFPYHFSVAFFSALEHVEFPHFSRRKLSNFHCRKVPAVKNVFFLFFVEAAYCDDDQRPKTTHAHTERAPPANCNTSADSLSVAGKRKRRKTHRPLPSRSLPPSIPHTHTLTKWSDIFSPSTFRHRSRKIRRFHSSRATSGTVLQYLAVPQSRRRRFQPQSVGKLTILQAFC